MKNNIIKTIVTIVACIGILGVGVAQIPPTFTCPPTMPYDCDPLQLTSNPTVCSNSNPVGAMFYACAGTDDCCQYTCQVMECTSGEWIEVCYEVWTEVIRGIPGVTPSVWAWVEHCDLELVLCYTGGYQWTNCTGGTAYPFADCLSNGQCEGFDPPELE